MESKLRRWVVGSCWRCCWGLALEIVLLDFLVSCSLFLVLLSSSPHSLRPRNFVHFVPLSFVSLSFCLSSSPILAFLYLPACLFFPNFLRILFKIVCYLAFFFPIFPLSPSLPLINPREPRSRLPAVTESLPISGAGAQSDQRTSVRRGIGHYKYRGRKENRTTEKRYKPHGVIPICL